MWSSLFHYLGLVAHRVSLFDWWQAQRGCTHKMVFPRSLVHCANIFHTMKKRQHENKRRYISIYLSAQKLNSCQFLVRRDGELVFNTLIQCFHHLQFLLKIHLTKQSRRRLSSWSSFDLMVQEQEVPLPWATKDRRSPPWSSSRVSWWAWPNISKDEVDISSGTAAKRHPTKSSTFARYARTYVTERSFEYLSSGRKRRRGENRVRRIRNPTHARTCRFQNVFFERVRI